MHGFHWGGTLLWVQQMSESLRILDTLPGGHWVGAREHRKNSLSSRFEEESKEGSSQGCWTPCRLSKRLLEPRSARRASDSPSEGERLKRLSSLWLWVIGKLRRESVFMYAGETQGKEFTEGKSKGWGLLHLENSSKSGRTCMLKRSTAAVGSGWERYLDRWSFHVQGEVEERAGHKRFWVAESRSE